MPTLPSNALDILEATKALATPHLKAMPITLEDPVVMVEEVPTEPATFAVTGEIFKILSMEEVRSFTTTFGTLDVPMLVSLVLNLVGWERMVTFPTLCVDLSCPSCHGTALRAVVLSNNSNKHLNRQLRKAVEEDVHVTETTSKHVKILAASTTRNLVLVLLDKPRTRKLWNTIPTTSTILLPIPQAVV